MSTLKGQKHEMVFWLNPTHLVEKKDLEKFLLWTIISRAMPSFVSLDVLGEDAKSLFAHSLCTHKFFLRSFSPYTPRSLGVYGEGFDEIGEKKEHFRAFSM
jgi:hypothetical protein